MGCLWNLGDVLTRMHRRKKDTLCTLHGGRNIQAHASTKFLDVKYELYGSSGDLIETNN